MATAAYISEGKEVLDEEKGEQPPLLTAHRPNLPVSQFGMRFAISSFFKSD